MAMEGAKLRLGAELWRAVRRRHRVARKVCAADARAACRADDRLGRPPRIRADARHARTAYPPREGDFEHLHESGALRAGRHGAPDSARQRRLARDGGAESFQGAVRAGGTGENSGREARRFDAPFFNEFTIELPRSVKMVNADLLQRENYRAVRAGHGLSGTDEARAGLRHGNDSARGDRALRRRLAARAGTAGLRNWSTTRLRQ